VTLNEFLARLDDIRTQLPPSRVRDSVFVIVAVPGAQWELAFLDDGTVRWTFISDGTIHDETVLAVLADWVD
jgi:hypothetical protein